LKVFYIYIYNISLSLRNFLGLYFLYYIYYIYNINLFCKNRACCILYLYNIHPNINPENRKEREKNCNCYNSNRLTFYNFLYVYLKSLFSLTLRNKYIIILIRNKGFTKKTWHILKILKTRKTHT